MVLTKFKLRKQELKRIENAEHGYKQNNGATCLLKNGT